MRVSDEQIISKLGCDRKTVEMLRDKSQHPALDVSLETLGVWVSKLGYTIVTQVLPVRPYHGLGAPEPRKRNDRRMQYGYGVTSKSKG
jgi:hypothetical protein